MVPRQALWLRYAGIHMRVRLRFLQVVTTNKESCCNLPSGFPVCDFCWDFTPSGSSTTSLLLKLVVLTAMTPSAAAPWVTDASAEAMRLFAVVVTTS